MTMTVKQLINALSCYPEDTVVEIWKGWCVESQSDYYVEIEDLEINEDGKLTFS